MHLYLVANLKLEQLPSRESVRSRTGYQAGRVSMLVRLGEPVNMEHKRNEHVCLLVSITLYHLANGDLWGG